MSRNYRSVDQRGNGYCGPLVLAAIMGCTTAEAAAKVRAHNGAASVKGTSTGDVRWTLKNAGWKTEPVPMAKHYAADRGVGVPTGCNWRNHEGWHVRVAVGPPPTIGVAVKGPRFAPGQAQDWFAYDSRTAEPAEFTPVKMVGPTLAEWLRATTTTRGDAFYIVEVSNHWVLVRGRKFVDTFTKGEWVFLRSAPHRRKRVKEVWKVTRV